MLHVDIPTRKDFTRLSAIRADACLSIYVKTTPLTQHIDAARIEFRNLVDEALAQLTAIDFDKRRLAALSEQLQELRDDEEFWTFQANSLAVFATPDRIRTFRLGNHLTSKFDVADRFDLGPLFRAIAFPHAALVLALSENEVRLVEVEADLPPRALAIADMPRDFESFSNKGAMNDKSQRGQLHSLQGHNVRLTQYVRRIDAVLRPVLQQHDLPLILAATGRLGKLFGQITSYPHFVEEIISISPDRVSEAELAASARPILDRVYRDQLAEQHALFELRSGEHRTSNDVNDIARAATFGMVATLLVDMDASLPGFVDDGDGRVRLVSEDDAKAYNVVAEIATRAFANGGDVLAVRRDEIPGGGPLAAILRYPL